MNEQPSPAVSVDQLVPTSVQDGAMPPTDPKHASEPAPAEGFPPGYRPGFRARRRLDRLAVRAAEREDMRSQLALEVELHAAADQMIAGDDAGGEQDVPAGRLARALAWIQERRVLLVVAGLTLSLGMLIVLLQLGFYRTLPGLSITIHGVTIPVWLMMPLANEGFTWAYGMMASLSVYKKRGNPARYIRRMWMFASIAAAINVIHNVVALGDVATGIASGLLSVFTPGLWHSYVGMTSAHQEGVTTKEIRQAFVTRLRHPVTSWRADDIETLLQVPRDVAWKYALGYKPGEIKSLIREQVRADLDGERIEVLAPPTLTRPAKPVQRKDMKRAIPAPPPPAEKETAAESPPESDPKHAKPAEVVNFTLAAEFGKERARAIELWLNYLDKGEQPPSFNQLDRDLYGKVTKTSRQAITAYIERYGDPRDKAVNQ